MNTNENSMPLVSIVIPVYNGSDYLREAIESALNQNYSNIEVIVINDGSNDSGKTALIANEYGSRIRYFEKNNGGVASALNLGIEKMRGKYFSWLSHDDVYYPDKIQTQIDCATKFNNKKIIIFSDFDSYDVDNEILKTEKLSSVGDWVRDENFYLTLKVLFLSGMHGCSLLIPRDAFIDCGFFDVNLATTQDYALFMNFLSDGYLFYHIPRALIMQRVHSLQDTKFKYNLHMSEVRSMYISAIKKFEYFFNFLNKEQLFFFREVLSYKGYDDLAHRLALANEASVQSCLHLGDNDLIGNKFNGHDLHQYLISYGMKASHLVDNKESDDSNTYINTQKSFDKYTRDILQNSLFLEAECIHLHLIHNTLFDINYLPIVSMLKPTVWTLHDPWALGGHCIYPGDCGKWRDHCNDCSFLETPFAIHKDVTSLNFEMKKRAIQNSNIHCIVASKWMEDYVKQSPIFADKKIYRIPFGINQKLFKPEERSQLRQELNIPDKELVLFFRVQKNFKGLSILQEALDSLHFQGKISLITVGNPGLLRVSSSKYTLHEYGWIKDDLKLVQLYQSCDIFLMPSEQEAFGMMAIEAMSCGKMVLAVTGTSLQDVINSPHCGIACDRRSYSSELQRLINNPEEIIVRNARSLSYAQEHYGYERYVKQIMAVYQSAFDEFTFSDSARLILSQLRKHACEQPKLSVRSKSKVNICEYIPAMDCADSNEEYSSSYYDRCRSYYIQYGLKQTVMKIIAKIGHRLPINFN